MHHCLSIPEILVVILNYLRPPLNDEEGTPDCRSLISGPMLTCKLFLEPALDIIWESLDSFTPLVKLLPSDSDALRALSVASQIFLQGTPLLPSLQSLRIAFDDYTEDPWSAQLILTKNLRKIVVDLPNTSNEIKLAHKMILSSLGAMSPRIQYIRCQQLEGNVPSIRTCLWSGVCDMPNLRVAHFPDHAIESTALSHLGSLPNLHTATLFVADMVYPLVGTFPALQRLSLFSKDWDHLINFTQQGGMPTQLTEFIATVRLPNNGLTGPQLQRLAVSLAERCSATLVKIDLHAPPPRLDPQPPFEFATADIEPLLSCSSLQHLSLRLRCSTASFDDGLLSSLAKALPKLRHLNLAAQDQYGGQIASKCTPVSLLHLAQHCPHLEWIGLVFAAENHAEWAGKQKGSKPAQMVKYLGVGGTALLEGGCKPMALLLSAAFPHLQKIGHSRVHRDWQMESYQIEKAWEKVNDLYFFALQARMQEREWRVEEGPQTVHNNN
ncbi:hypothetical protein HWV62_39156 [Athelia sp. TMB]|nr:hypothetical protein HWV62_39156 [Athelia sp. TMB]